VSESESAPAQEKGEKAEKAADQDKAAAGADDNAPQPDEAPVQVKPANAISAAAQDPGATAERVDEMRRARESLMRFDGATELRDAINNQTNIILGQAVHTVGGCHELSRSTLTYWRQTHIERTGPLALNPVLTFVRGPAGSGKTTAAVCELVKDVDTILQLGPRTRLNSLAVDELKPSSGYLLDDLSNEAAAAVRGYDLDRLEAEFRRLGSRLVITVRPEVIFTDAAVDRYLVELGTRPDIREVFERHLRWRLGEQLGGLADELLARTDLGDLLTVELTEQAALGKAADIARLVAEHSNEPDTLVIRLRQRLSRSDDIDFAGWFDGFGTDLRQRCTAISLAVFNGRPYEAVTNSAALLMLLFRTESGRPDRRPIKPFGDSRTSRLHQLRAKVVPGSLSFRSGNSVPAELMEYVDPSFPGRVLHHVWKEHDAAHEGLVKWLVELGQDESRPARVRTATAVGDLTVLAYEHMRDEVLVPWANSRNDLCWESGAIALNFAADADAGLAGMIKNLVQDWSFGTDSEKAAAARCHGIGFAGLSRETALATLRRLAEEDLYMIQRQAAEGLLDLVNRSDQDESCQVLEIVLKWAADRNENRRSVAKFAFLLMCVQLDDDKPGELRWPLVLRLAHARPDKRQLLGDLWATSLNGADFAEAALVVVNNWASRVDGHETGRQAFVALLRAACTSPRPAARLRKHVNQWLKSHSEITAKTTARELLAVLPKEAC
jgi:hypothetical protein